MNWKSAFDPILPALGLARSRAMYFLKPFALRRLTRFYREILPPKAFCYDAGAHLGNRTLAMLRAGCKVLALEPQPRLFLSLSNRFEQESSCILLPQALDSKTGVVTLYINDYAPTISTLSDEFWRQAMHDSSLLPSSWKHQVQVPATTLDDLIAEYGLPNFIKLDVEGYEYQALSGLSHKVELLAFEYITLFPEQLSRCLDRLETLGYREFQYTIRERHHFEGKAWMDRTTLEHQVRSLLPRVISGDVYAR